MKDENQTTDARILEQLKLIANTNQLIESSKRRNSPLQVRQYEHLKKKLTKNLFEMLQESYQITIPDRKEAA